jgi:hypothetical protein
MDAEASKKTVDRQQLVSWIQLNDADPEMRLVAVRFPSDTKRLVLVAGDDLPEATVKALVEIGFYRSRSGFFVRDDLRFSLPTIRRAFPNAAPVKMPMNQVTRIMPGRPSPARPDTDDEKPVEPVVAVNNAVMSAVPLGVNHLGQVVYQGEDGRFISDVQKNIIREAEARSGATFLYGSNPEDMALCADGLVREVAGGKVFRFDDLKRFATVITGVRDEDLLASPVMREVQESVEAALVRHLRRYAGPLGKTAYNLAIKLEEGQPPMAARTSDSVRLQQYSTPLPMSVVVQRIVGPTAGKAVLEPTIGNGSLVCGMPDAFVTGCDLDERRLANVRRDRKDAQLHLSDATSVDFRELNDGQPFDVVVSNPPFGGLQVPRMLQGLKLTRIDHFILVRSIMARTDEGLGVYIVGADSYIDSKSGQVAGGSRNLFNWLADHYHVDVVEVDGGMFAKQGASFPIRIVVVGKRGPGGPQVADHLQVIQDHDELFEWSSRMQAKYSLQQAVVSPVAPVPAPAPVVEDVEPPAATGDSLADASGKASTEPNVSDQEENSYQSPYSAFSGVSDATAMIPRNLATPTRIALAGVVEESGDVDEFVAGELGWSVDEMAGYLAPEQVDAVALAIHSVRKGRGFLEADQTGLGKGRVMAALARFSALNNTPVIFLTETPTLFTDFWRDIRDIGSDSLFTPMIVNEGVAVYDPISGSKLIAPTPRTVMDTALRTGSLDPAYNMVLGTYSQFNRDRSSSAKARWIGDVARGKALLIDEAHNAAGESNTGHNIGMAIDQAEYVVYSSATSMKDGRNVMLYSQLFPSTVDMGALPETLATGGEVLQEVLSGMLARDGVFVRREHDLSNLTFRTVTDIEREERNRVLSDRLAEILEYMNYLAGDINQLVNARNKEIKKLLEKIPEKERKGNRMGALNVNFGSRLFAIYRQFMMALKVDLATERSIRALENGQKPVIVLSNTMESLLKDLVLKNEVDIADSNELAEVDASGLSALLQGEVELDEEMSFRDVLYRMLDRLTYYCETTRYGEVVKTPITSNEAMETVAFVHRLIDEFPDLPVSPLDDIRRRIAAAGFVCDELSGRKLQIVERDGHVYASPMAERPKAQIVKDFVTGNSDALLLTRAGSTGISLHAGEKFPDQRQRVMIELQDAPDVNVRVQFFGRVNRKGQTSAPEIETLSSGLIGEARPIAMQNAKLRRLSANTTANQDNAALNRQVPDFINAIGDEVAYRYLEANPAIARRLDIDMDNDDERAESYFINKLTSRLIMLRVTEQEQIYEALTNEYLRVIKELDAKGTNPLKSREMDVRAREVSREVYESGNPHSDSAFNQPVYAKTIEYEVRINPIRSAEVKDRVRLGADAVKRYPINHEGRENQEFFLALKGYLASNRSQFLKTVLGKEFKSIDEAMAAKRANAVQKMLARLQVLDTVLDGLHVGAVARFTNDEEETDFGIVTRVVVPDNPKHIHLLGAYELAFAVPGKQGLVERTLYSLQADAQFRVMPKSAMQQDLMAKFDTAPEGIVVMQRLILDGNLFKAAQIAAANTMGSSVIYSDVDGNRHRGVLLARGVEMKHLQNLAVRVETPAMCREVLTRFEEILLCSSPDTKGAREKDLMLRLQDGQAILEVPGTKSHGGKYFADEDLIKVTGPFAGSRAGMSAKFPVENIESATAILYRKGVSMYVDPSYREAINRLNALVYTNESCVAKGNAVKMA